MYNKPMIFGTNDLAEGVYAASGCYTESWSRTQVPETGRDSYVFHISARHEADHTRGAQKMVVVFTQPVTFLQCNMNGCELVSGSGTNTLTFKLGYHQNPTDNIGGGDLYVQCSSDVNITNVTITD